MGTDFWKKFLTLGSGMSILLAFVLSFFGFNKESVIFYYASIIAGGYFVLVSAIHGIVGQKFLNINFLVVIATLGAVYINQIGEAAAVIFFFSLAELFEEYGIEKSKMSIETLIKKAPKTAILKNGESVAVELVKKDDIILIRPGDLIPLDGKVIKGMSSVDESMITGESIPKDKREDDIVFSGTMNQNGFLEIEVTKENKDSTFNKIVQLIEVAQRSRAPTQEFIDKFAKYYTPSVVVAAILFAIIPALFFGGIFTEWLYKALILLVISCPCALVISTPVSIASAIGGAAKRGVLIKGGKHLEEIGKTKVVAFDKTRTLTLGQTYVTDVMAFGDHTEEEVLADAAGIEKFSSHPLSKSILNYIQEKGITPHIMEKYENFSGKGGKAICISCNGLEHAIGNIKFMGVVPSAILKACEELEKNGKTVVIVREENQIIGALGIADTIRKEAREAVSLLNTMNIESAMLTGDNPHAAKYIADKTGIKMFFASLLPQEKVQKIDALRKEYKSILMVGDGVNDAPALATANVGMAMGAGGSDVAIETADIALMNNNLLNVPHSISLGKKTLKVIKQNIVVSLGVKFIFLCLAVLGLARLEFAIGADSGVAILVILNGLRLLRFKLPLYTALGTQKA